MSIFAFASPALEDAFQEYAANKPNPWALLHPSLILISFLRFPIKYCFAEEQLRAAVPASVPIWLVAHACACTIIPAIMRWKPGMYSVNRRTFHACYMVFVALTFNAVRVVVLWMHVVGASGPKSWEQSPNFFFVQNFHAATAWLFHLAYPVGQFPDIILATVILFRAFAFNRSMCELPLFANQTVRTLSMVMSSLKPASNGLQTLSNVMLFLADPAMALQGLQPVVSYPAISSLWQVVGWWVACHTTFAADLCRRRAFLRTSAALTRIDPGPDLHWVALKWPFQSNMRLLAMFMASFGITFYASMFWLNAYTFFR